MDLPYAQLRHLRFLLFNRLSQPELDDGQKWGYQRGSELPQPEEEIYPDVHQADQGALSHGLEPLLNRREHLQLSPQLEDEPNH